MQINNLLYSWKGKIGAGEPEVVKGLYLGNVCKPEAITNFKNLDV